MQISFKKLKPLAPQVTLSDTVSLPMLKEVLKEAPLPRVQGTVDTDKNINYSPTLPSQFPSSPVTNRYTSTAANTVYDIIQKSI